jgi:hypothetical protein
MCPRFLKRSYGGKVLVAIFTLSMKIEPDPERGASAMVYVPPLFEKTEDMFLGLSIRPIICLRGQSIIYKTVRLIRI